MFSVSSAFWLYPVFKWVKHLKLYETDTIANMKISKLWCLFLGSMHTVVPIKQVTAGIRRQLNKLTEEVYKKMKRCRNIEKSAWRRLSDYEEHVETIHKQIDESIEQMVRHHTACRWNLRYECHNSWAALPLKMTCISLSISHIKAKILTVNFLFSDVFADQRYQE